jgi:bile acid:Na+ symporter, BASS family
MTNDEDENNNILNKNINSLADASNNNYNLLLLLVIVLASIIGGILLPDIGRLFSPYLLVWLGILLFLNLIKLDLADLASAFVKPMRILVLSAVKIAIIPLALYAITNAFYPSESLSVLLLSGISTGLGAPFVVNFVGGGRKLHLVVGMIIVTSLLVPFTLPSLVFWLFNTHFSIPLSDMVILLSIALFIPLGSGWVTRRYSPRAAVVVDRRSLPLSMIVIALINFGMFARFSNYFFKDTEFVVITIMSSSLFFVIYGLSGYSIGRILNLLANYKKGNTINSNSETNYDLISSFISMSYVNNVLVAVFAEQFFGPKVAALAAFYNIPYYIGILLLKKAHRQTMSQMKAN